MELDARDTMVDILTKCHRIHMGLTIVDLIVLLSVYKYDGLYSKKELSGIIGLSYKQVNISACEMTSHRKTNMVHYHDGTSGEAIDDMRLLRFANNRRLHLTERGKRVCRSVILSSKDSIATAVQLGECKPIS